MIFLTWTKCCFSIASQLSVISQLRLSDITQQCSVSLFSLIWPIIPKSHSPKRVVFGLTETFILDIGYSAFILLVIKNNLYNCILLVVGFQFFECFELIKLLKKCIEHSQTWMKLLTSERIGCSRVPFISPTLIFVIDR